MAELINLISNILWGSVLIYLLLGTGIYFTIRSRFIQFRHFSHMFSVMKNSRNPDPSGISSFQAVCTTLGARMGTGNLVGIAIALTAGGPGAIFWMWVVALVGMSTSFMESTLAQLYKVKDDHGQYRGGPAYYMERGLGMRWMGVLFSLLLIAAVGLAFNALQANAIAQASAIAFNVKPAYVGIGLMLLSGPIIFGGLRAVAKASEKLVPLMVVAYLLVSLWIVGQHLEKLPDILLLVLKSAFGLQEVATGAVAYGISQALTMGVQRGLFSNEAGMGSAPNGAACAAPYPRHPASQGYVQMLSVLIDTLVICTATAAIILTSGLLDDGVTTIKGIEITQKAMALAIGDWGKIFIAVAIFFFAFTSIIANYAYAENNLIFLNRNRSAGLLIFRCATLAMVMFGTLVDLPMVWKIADITMALMAICNLIAILLLSGVAIRLSEDYNRQRRLGKTPVFDIENHADLKQQLEPGVWEQP